MQSIAWISFLRGPTASAPISFSFFMLRFTSWNLLKLFSWKILTNCRNPIDANHLLNPPAFWSFFSRSDALSLWFSSISPSRKLPGPSKSLDRLIVLDMFDTPSASIDLKVSARFGFLDSMVTFSLRRLCKAEKWCAGGVAVAVIGSPPLLGANGASFSSSSTKEILLVLVVASIRTVDLWLTAFTGTAASGLLGPGSSILPTGRGGTRMVTLCFLTITQPSSPSESFFLLAGFAATCLCFGFPMNSAWKWNPIRNDRNYKQELFFPKQNHINSL